MPNRGHLLAAARLLQIVFGITISVKFYIVHIIRITIGKFNINKPDVPKLHLITDIIQGSSSTFDKFIKQCHLIVNEWDVIGK